MKLKIALVLGSGIGAGGANTYEKSLLQICEEIQTENNNIVFDIYLPNSNTREDSPHKTYSDSKLSRRINKIKKVTSSILRMQNMTWSLHSLEKDLLRSSCNLAYFASPNPISSEFQRIPCINTVWDLGHRERPEFPEFSNNGQWQGRESYYSCSLPKSFHIFTDSAKTVENIKDFYGVIQSKCTSIGLLPRKNTDILPNKELSSEEVQSPYFYYPAQKWPHKNHLVLLEALEILMNKGITPNLVFSGADKGSGKQIAESIKQKNLENLIVDLGFVSQHDLTKLIQNAVAVLMPSALGPTNLPPLEALIEKTRAIVSDSHFYPPHIAQELIVAKTFDPYDWAEQMEYILGNKEEMNFSFDYITELEKSKKQILEVLEDFRTVSARWNFTKCE